MTGPEWRFGLGQTKGQERAEIERAKAEGRAEEYIAAQAEARAQTPVAERDREPSETRTRTRVRAAPACAPASRTPKPAAASPADGTEAYVDGLLADHRRGFLQPTPIAIPDAAPDWTRPVAEVVALVVGLRLTVGDRRHPILGTRWVGRLAGCSHHTASRALRTLADPSVAWLSVETPMPGRKRHRGTAVYGVAGVTVDWARDSDGVPDPSMEAGAVPVEAQHVGAPSTAVEPSSEAVDEPGVGDAVGRGHGLTGVVASGDGAEVGVGHGSPRYARTPTPTTLLARALKLPTSERRAAWWLARQLQANGHDEHGAAFEAMAEFAKAASPRFTLADALRTLRAAYALPPLDPWGPPRNGGVEPTPLDPEPGDEPDAGPASPTVDPPPMPDRLPGEAMRDWQDRTRLPDETTKQWARRRRDHEAARAGR